MRPVLRQLVDYVRSKKVFQRNKKRVEIKVLAGLLYFFGISFKENESVSFSIRRDKS